MKNIIIILFALLPLLGFGQGTPISSYPAASALQGDEVFPGLQPGTGGPGTTRKISINQIKTYVFEDGIDFGIITGLPTTLAGYGITDAATILYVDAQLAGKQAIDGDLTAIAGLSPSNDDVIQRKAGAWVNRTMAQLKTDLALTKSDVGLSNVDNTSDANKPISSATQTALDAKQATLVSGTNIKTINGSAILGSGDLTISSGGATAAGATGNVQYKSAGGGLQAEAALTYDSAANILTVPSIKITGGSPGAGKFLISDADGDATWDGKYIIDQASASTAGATITLDCNSQIQRSFVGSATFATPKTLALSNTTNTLFFNVYLEITDVAAVLTVPADWLMSIADFDGDDWNPPSIGKYEFGGSFDDTNNVWYVKVSGPFN